MIFEKVEINSNRWLKLRNLKDEIWKDIKDYEGLYQISNYGRIKSFAKGKSKILKLSKQTFHYTNKDYVRYKIDLCNNKHKKSYKIHRLVAQAFIPNPQNKPQINHIDGNPCNNIFTNLEWCDAKENIVHSYKHIRILNKKYDENKILKMIHKNIPPHKIVEENHITKAIYNNILKRNNIAPKPYGYWNNKYKINKEKLKEDFKKGFKNKELAIKYKTNTNLIAKYKEKYKKGEI